MRKGKTIFLFLFVVSCLAYFYSLNSKKSLSSQTRDVIQEPVRAVASKPDQPEEPTPLQSTPSAWARKISINPNSKPTILSANPQDLAEFIFNRPQTSWKIWNRMKAQYPAEAAQDKSVNVSQFQLSVDPVSNYALENFSLQEPVVLFEERLKTPGVLTGTFEIQLRDSRQWENFEKQHSLRLIQSFQELNLFYATSNQDRFNLSQLYKDLSQDPAVSTVNLEILSKQYEQN